ncbi:hypothetical protein BKA65DRAFT_22440 [Rhexocercosporidium sp. MPI-PUGE-AT-0058]|nr:hypothetical protein BKA65DRAFT_22440 [Rhexocercosporidium sp. MPI-PUGE-AT-0058]
MYTQRRSIQFLRGYRGQMSVTLMAFKRSTFSERQSLKTTRTPTYSRQESIPIHMLIWRLLVRDRPMRNFCVYNMWVPNPTDNISIRETIGLCEKWLDLDRDLGVPSGEIGRATLRSWKGDFIFDAGPNSGGINMKDLRDIVDFLSLCQEDHLPAMSRDEKETRSRKLTVVVWITRVTRRVTEGQNPRQPNFTCLWTTQSYANGVSVHQNHKVDGHISHTEIEVAQ